MQPASMPMLSISVHEFSETRLCRIEAVSCGLRARVKKPTSPLPPRYEMTRVILCRSRSGSSDRLGIAVVLGGLGLGLCSAVSLSGPWCFTADRRSLVFLSFFILFCSGSRKFGDGRKRRSLFCRCGRLLGVDRYRPQVEGVDLQRRSGSPLPSRWLDGPLSPPS